jgi:crotonobetainyl-CoA:carnitine CoA-transferase CaiB-like acyl-CoA transferase
MYKGIGPVPQLGIPVKLSLSPGKIGRKAAKVGEHNSEVYGRLLKYSKRLIRELEKKNII